MYTQHLESSLFNSRELLIRRSELETEVFQFQEKLKRDFQAQNATIEELVKSSSALLEQRAVSRTQELDVVKQKLIQERKTLKVNKSCYLSFNNICRTTYVF